MGFVLVLVLAFVPGRKFRVQLALIGLTNFKTKTALHTRALHVLHVFESNQFSFVAKSERKRFSAKTSFGPIGPHLGSGSCSSSGGWSCIEYFPKAEGRGICFEFMLWIFDEFLHSLFYIYVGVFTGFCSSNFL